MTIKELNKRINDLSFTKCRMEDTNMNSELKCIIKNATKTALTIDGYNQVIILGNDGSYSFTRKCNNCCPEWIGKIIGEVITYWKNGILVARYEDR